MEYWNILIDSVPAVTADAGSRRAQEPRHAQAADPVGKAASIRVKGPDAVRRSSGVAGTAAAAAAAATIGARDGTVWKGLIESQPATSVHGLRPAQSAKSRAGD